MLTSRLVSLRSRIWPSLLDCGITKSSSCNVVSAMLMSSKTKEEILSKKSYKKSDSFILSLYSDQPDISQVFPYPQVLGTESADTMSQLTSLLESCMKENDSLKNDENECFDPEFIKKMKSLGAYGIQVPQEFGGLGLNNTETARLAEVVGRNDLALGIMLGAHQSIGYKGIVLYGNKEQKEKYLEKLATGEELAAFCLTEHGTGSDAANIKARAVLSEDGKHYIINGGKLWISNGGFADVFTVFAQTTLKDPKTGETKDAITAFIVERKFGGITSGPPEKKMGIKASNTTEVFFEDVRVPVENVLGELGGGFKVAMGILNSGRFGMVATMSGTMKSLLEKAIEHTKSRVQFGKKLCEYEDIQFKLAKMASMQYAAESVAYLLSYNMDCGAQEYQMESAAGKCYASEAAWYTADECIQILGGMGFMKPTGLEKVLRDLRIFRIFEGSNDILRQFIALTGLQRFGKRMRSDLLGSTPFYLRRLSGFALSSPSVQLSAELKDVFKQSWSRLNTLAVKVAYLSMHGKGVIEHQWELRCLASATINLYALLASISRCDRSLVCGLPTAKHEVELVKVLVNHTLTSVDTDLAEISCLNKSMNHKQSYHKVSKDLINNDRVLTPSPLGF